MIILTDIRPEFLCYVALSCFPTAKFLQYQDEDKFKYSPSDDFICFIPKPEEKMKFDSIFDSLAPVGGILTGDKVKPVLLNSKLPVDILGRVGVTD